MNGLPTTQVMWWPQKCLCWAPASRRWSVTAVSPFSILTGSAPSNANLLQGEKTSWKFGAISHQVMSFSPPPNTHIYKTYTWIIACGAALRLPRMHSFVNDQHICSRLQLLTVTLPLCLPTEAFIFSVFVFVSSSRCTFIVLFSLQRITNLTYSGFPREGTLRCVSVL